jgi:hypothetical protein
MHRESVFVCSYDDGANELVARVRAWDRDLVDDRLEGRTRTQDRLRTAAISKRPSKAPVTVRFEPALAARG